METKTTSETFQEPKNIGFTVPLEWHTILAQKAKERRLSLKKYMVSQVEELVASASNRKADPIGQGLGAEARGLLAAVAEVIRRDKKAMQVIACIVAGFRPRLQA